MGKFLGWVAGILATAIGGWLVWYFTRPPATTTFEGMVINGAANTAVANAMVTIEIKGPSSAGDYHDVTNQAGSYGIDFTGIGSTSSATIQVSAEGFQPPASLSLSTLTSDNRRDFVLIPLPNLTPQPPVGGPHTPILIHPLTYVPKPTRPIIKLQP